jgi:hypothetical protein
VHVARDGVNGSLTRKDVAVRSRRGESARDRSVGEEKEELTRLPRAAG